MTRLTWTPGAAQAQGGSGSGGPRAAQIFVDKAGKEISKLAPGRVKEIVKPLPNLIQEIWTFFV